MEGEDSNIKVVGNVIGMTQYNQNNSDCLTYIYTFNSFAAAYLLTITHKSLFQ